MRRARSIFMLLVATGIIAATLAAAARKTRDAFWVRPDYGRLHIERIALIPVTTFDNNIKNENLVESLLGAAFKGTAYRWVSGTTTRELLRSHAGNDSLLKALKAGILANARVDSATAPAFASLLRCDALLSVRVDQWDQQTPDWNQAGKPYTTVQLRAALVDSAGRLLWTASGGQTGEGPYYDPKTNPTSVNDSGLERKPVSSQGGAPEFREVVTTLLARWVDQFPAKPSVEATPAEGAAPAAAPDSAASH